MRACPKAPYPPLAPLALPTPPDLQPEAAIAGRVLRYRCHTGHAYTAEALAESARHHLEESLRGALRTMEKRKNLLSATASHGDARQNQP